MPFGRKRPEESGEPSVERQIVLRAFAFEKVTELNGAADVADVNTPAVEKPGKKRTSAGIVENTGNEVHSMLEKLGDFINNVILAKKKRLSIYTKASLKASSQKIEHIWKTQQDQRQKLNQEYSQQFLTLFHEWEMEMQKTEEQVEKLTNLFQQQHKLFQQSRVYQSQRLNAIKQLHEQFTKSMLELDKDQDTLLAGAQDELKKEMALLQKQIMMDTQQQEMASVRKSLQSILY